jgi:O-antigen/teichoic acid export membrane protein
MTAPAIPSSSPTLVDDLRRATRHAAMLASSVALGWVISIGVKLVVPRVLGKEVFGHLTFAEAFAAITTGVLILGVDTYVRKEVASRPAHAKEFATGILLVRLVLWAVVLFGGITFLTVTAQPLQVVWLYALAGVAQFFLGSAVINAAYLQAVQQARTLSVAAIVTKVLWAVIILGGFLLGARAWIVPVALGVTEGVKNLWYLRRGREELGIGEELEWATTLAVLFASLPFFAQQISGMLMSQLDVTLVGFIAGKSEVGYYGVALVVGMAALLLAPVIQWVVLPLLSKTADRSLDDMWTLAHSATALVATLAIPVAVLLSLNADIVVEVLFGTDYLPAVPAIRVLGFMFIATYASALFASILVKLGRAWAIAGITFGVVALDTGMNLVLLPRAVDWWGDGGAALAAAISLVTAEVVGTVALMGLLGRRIIARTVILPVALMTVAAVIALVVGYASDLDRVVRIGLEVGVLLIAALVCLSRIKRSAFGGPDVDS